jgi:hypothetical protein
MDSFIQLINNVLGVASVLDVAIEKVDKLISPVQEALNLSYLSNWTEFRSSKSLGKMGVGGFILGIFFGASFSTLLISLLLVVTLSPPPSSLYTLVSISRYPSHDNSLRSIGISTRRCSFCFTS